MTSSVHGKTLVVTGALAGIGRAVALAFPEESPRVTVLARHGGRLESLCEQMRARGGTAHPIVADVPDAHALDTIGCPAADKKSTHTLQLIHAMPMIGTVGLDPEFAEAERNGRAPVDHAPDSAGVVAIRGIADRLRQLKPGLTATR